MHCENEVCIYQKDGNCILPEITIDVRGSCSEFIIANFDSEYLEKVKNKVLKRYSME